MKSQNQKTDQRMPYVSTDHIFQNKVITSKFHHVFNYFDPHTLEIMTDLHANRY